MDVVIAGQAIRPATPEGDAFFGLESGTNGSAATGRRALVEPEGAQWTRHDGKPATGLFLVPGASAWANPWAGPVEARP